MRRKKGNREIGETMIKSQFFTVICLDLVFVFEKKDFSIEICKE